jgi:hypothetical protein
MNTDCVPLNISVTHAAVMQFMLNNHDLNLVNTEMDTA